MLKVGLDPMLPSGKLFTPLLLFFTASKKVSNYLFYVTPHCASFKNIRSALQHAEFVYEAFLGLVSTNRIAQVAKSHPKVINPLLESAQSCGEKLLILDVGTFISTYLNRSFNLRTQNGGKLSPTPI